MSSLARRWISTQRSVPKAGFAAVALLVSLCSAPCAAEQMLPEAGPRAAWADVVCAEVVLAIDGSRSTEAAAFYRQVVALDAAFRDQRVHRAIQDCLPGSVAFSALTWSSGSQQQVCVYWRVVTGGAGALDLAGRLRSCGYIGGTTDLGRALEAALALLHRAPFESYYRIIFLLTNGRTDQDSEAVLATARAAAVRAGITIDAYALLGHLPRHPPPGFVDDGPRFARYVASEVSAGPRAFTAASRPGDDAETLVRAFIEMLRQEIN